MLQKKGVSTSLWKRPFDGRELSLASDFGGIERMLGQDVERAAIRAAQQKLQRAFGHIDAALFLAVRA
jgi:hypothetical protein